MRRIILDHSACDSALPATLEPKLIRLVKFIRLLGLLDLSIAFMLGNVLVLSLSLCFFQHFLDRPLRSLLGLFPLPARHMGPDARVLGKLEGVSRFLHIDEDEIGIHGAVGDGKRGESGRSDRSEAGERDTARLVSSPLGSLSYLNTTTIS